MNEQFPGITADDFEQRFLAVREQVDRELTDLEAEKPGPLADIGITTAYGHRVAVVLGKMEVLAQLNQAPKELKD